MPDTLAQAPAPQQAPVIMQSSSIQPPAPLSFSGDSITWPEAWRAHEIAQRMRQVIAHVRCIKQVDF